MLCSNCRAANPEGQKFCGGCGAALISTPPAADVPIPSEDGANYCAKHPKAITRLRCGRCESPICPRCTAYTPAGTRCRECAKNKIAVRPAGVLHSAAGMIADTSQGVGRRVWCLAIWYLILSFFRNPFDW